MGLSTKDVSGASGGGNSMGTEIANGVYVAKTKIKRVLNISGKPLEYFREPQAFDLAVRVEFNEPDLSFVPSIDIYGNFKKEGGEIIGWGSAFKVGRFFRELGIVDELTDDQKIPSEWLGQCAGRQVMKITYAAGMQNNNPTKVKWVTWDLLVDCSVSRNEQEAIEVMKEQWEFQIAQGYPKNYDPSGLGAGKSSRNDNVPTQKVQSAYDPIAASQGSAPAPQQPKAPVPQPPPVDDGLDDDDDMPF